MQKLTHGVGINDRSRHTMVNGKQIREYMSWKSMIARCYSPLVHERAPTYIGCHVSDNFKHYTYFYDWCQNQKGYNNKGWELDKDLLIKNNKLYSENNCVFLPPCINMAQCKNISLRGGLPIGVTFNKAMQKYKVSCRNGESKNRAYLGYHSSIGDAFLVYKNYKERYIKELAEKYKDQIDPRAYEALMNYSIDITD